MFDSLLGRTCLHYAAYFGHSDCLQTIISAAHYSPVAGSWLVSLVSSYCSSLNDIKLHGFVYHCCSLCEL